MPIIIDGGGGAGYMGAGASLAGQRNAMQNDNMQRAFQTGIGLYQSQLEREDRKKQLAQQQQNWDKSFEFDKEQADQNEAWKTYKATQDELERDRLIRRDQSDRGYLASMLGKPELANTDVSPDVLRSQVDRIAQQNGVFDTHQKKAMFDMAMKRQEDEKAANGVGGMVASMAENGLVQPEEADAIFKLLRDNPEQAQNVANGVQQRFQVQWAKQRQKMERSEQANSMRSFMQTATWMDPTKRKRLEMMADGVEAGIFTPDDFAKEMAGTNSNGYSADQIDAMVKTGALTPQAAAQLGSMGGDKVMARTFARDSMEPPKAAKFDPTTDPEVQAAEDRRQASLERYRSIQRDTAQPKEAIDQARMEHDSAAKEAAMVKARAKSVHYVRLAAEEFRRKFNRAPDSTNQADRDALKKIATELEGR